MPRPPKSKDPKDQPRRLSLAVSPLVSERLESLRVRTDAESLTEVIRRALTYYDHLVDVQKSGGRIIIEQDGKQKELRVLL